MKLIEKARVFLVIAGLTYATVGCDLKPTSGSMTPAPTTTMPQGAVTMATACCSDPGYFTWLATSRTMSGQCPSGGLLCTFVNPTTSRAGDPVSTCNTVVPSGWVVTNNVSAGTCLNQGGMLEPKQTMMKVTGLKHGINITTCSSPPIIPPGWTLVSSQPSSPSCSPLYGSHIYRNDNP